MDITIHTTALPHDDPEASLAFYRDTLGFEVRSDVGNGKMRWITVGPPGQPGTSILLAPPATDPGITGDERRMIAEMMAKGTYGWIMLATPDLNGTFDKVQAAGAEVVQEPIEQPYGIRDCAFRDPAGNLVRIQELRLAARRSQPRPAQLITGTAAAENAQASPTTSLEGMAVTPDQWIERYRRAWETADAGEVVELFTPGASYRSSVFREPYLGSDAIRQYWQRGAGTQRDVAVRMGRPVITADRVAVEWWTTMIDPDEGEITLPGCLLLRFAADGRCHDLWEYWQVQPGRQGPPDGWGR